MNDFLARLVSSAAGAVAAPRPIAPSRFQPAPQSRVADAAMPAQDWSRLDVLDGFADAAPAPRPELRPLSAAPDPASTPRARSSAAENVHLDVSLPSPGRFVEAPRTAAPWPVPAPAVPAERLIAPPASPSPAERLVDAPRASTPDDESTLERVAPLHPSVTTTPLGVVEHRETPSARARREPTIVPVETAPPRPARRGVEAGDLEAAPDAARGRDAPARDPFARAAALAPAPADGASADPPVVHVTIGRIEVRAMTEAPAPVRAAPAPFAPASGRLSLDQYLRERSEGRR